MANKYNGKMFPCGICGKQYPRKSKLLIHTRTHSGERPFQCSTCNKKFPSKSNLSSHEKLHLTAKPYSCNVCQKRFTYVGNLKQHSAIHSKEKRFICQFCKHMFIHRNSYKSHLSRHTEFQNNPEFQFRCRICGCRYKSKRWLLNHMKQDHKLQDCDLFECLFCNKIIQPASDFEIEYHISSHTKETAFFCKLCSSTFRIAATLKHHLRIQHKSAGVYRDAHECIFCEKTFSFKQPLDQHLLSHIQERPHSCRVCSMEFTSNGNLRQHLKTHDAIRLKTFQCDLCPSKFYTKGALQGHIKSHLGEKPFKCGLCSRDFQSSMLRKDHHERFHSNKRAHDCNICGKAFKTRPDLWEHIHIHTGENKVPSCKICLKRFRKPYNVKLHMRQCHQSVSHPLT